MPPFNDAIAAATVIAGASGTVDDDSTTATYEAGEATLLYDAAGVFGAGGGRSLWYAWTAPDAAPISFWTTRQAGSPYGCTGGVDLCDSLITVLDGNNYATAAVVTSNDDYPGHNGWSQVDFVPVGGHTYYISVDGYNGTATDDPGYDITNTAAGLFRLNWGTPPLPPGPPIITYVSVTPYTYGALVVATINPSNGGATSWRIQYGPTGGYGSQTPSESLPDGGSPVTVTRFVGSSSSVNNPDIPPSTLQHYRIRASNSRGTTNGADQTFTTDAYPSPPGNDDI